MRPSFLTSLDTAFSLLPSNHGHDQLLALLAASLDQSVGSAPALARASGSHPRAWGIQESGSWQPASRLRRSALGRSSFAFKAHPQLSPIASGLSATSAEAGMEAGDAATSAEQGQQRDQLLALMSIDASSIWQRPGGAVDVGSSTGSHASEAAGNLPSSHQGASQLLALLQESACFDASVAAESSSGGGGWPTAAAAAAAGEQVPQALGSLVADMAAVQGAVEAVISASLDVHALPPKVREEEEKQQWEQEGEGQHLHPASSPAAAWQGTPFTPEAAAPAPRAVSMPASEPGVGYGGAEAGRAAAAHKGEAGAQEACAATPSLAQRGSPQQERPQQRAAHQHPQLDQLLLLMSVDRSVSLFGDAIGAGADLQDAGGQASAAPPPPLVVCSCSNPAPLVHAAAACMQCAALAPA